MNEPKRLVYFDVWMDPVAGQMLDGHRDIELCRLDFAQPAEEIWRVMEHAHGYQVRPRTELREPFFVTPELIQRCPGLLAVSSTGAGYDMIDVEACTAQGILVVNQTGANKEAVAQHVLGMMLSLSKQIIQSDRALRSHRGWDRHDFTGRQIDTRTLGIIGIGNVGTRVSELCRGMFGMRVLAHDPYLTPRQFEERGAEPVELDRLLGESDFVSVNCPRTDETFGMIGARELALMKPTAFFINTARGGIHDEPALAEALARGGIAGAGIDVWLEEPPAMDHPLLQFDNVILSPHTAGVTDEARYNMGQYAAEQWIAIFRGERPPRPVNPEVWPRYAERFRSILGGPVED